MKPNSVWRTIWPVFFIWSLLAGQTNGVSESARQDLKGFDSTFVRAEEASRMIEKGKLFMRDHDTDTARKFLEKAILLDKSNPEARYWLGCLEKEAGRHHLAVDHLELVYRENPVRDSLCILLAESYLALGECALARTWFEREKKHSPDFRGKTALESKIKDCLKRIPVRDGGKK